MTGRDRPISALETSLIYTVSSRTAGLYRETLSLKKTATKTLSGCEIREGLCLEDGQGEWEEELREDRLCFLYTYMKSSKKNKRY